MSRFQTLKIGLERLLDEVRQMQLDKLGKGHAVALGSDKLDKIHERLAGIERRVRIAQLQAQSMEHLAGLRARSIHDLPREGRYSERQSIQAQQADAEDLRAIAAELVRALRDVYPDLLKFTGADLVEKLPKLLKELGGGFDHSTLDKLLHQPSGPEFAPAPGASLSAADFLSLTLAMLVFVMRRRKKD